jgi:hypothetical protein
MVKADAFKTAPQLAGVAEGVAGSAGWLASQATTDGAITRFACKNTQSWMEAGVALEFAKAGVPDRAIKAVQEVSQDAKVAAAMASNPITAAAGAGISASAVGGVAGIALGAATGTAALAALGVGAVVAAPVALVTSAGMVGYAAWAGSAANDPLQSGQSFTEWMGSYGSVASTTVLGFAGYKSAEQVMQAQMDLQETQVVIPMMKSVKSAVGLFRNVPVFKWMGCVAQYYNVDPTLVVPTAAQEAWNSAGPALQPTAMSMDPSLSGVAVSQRACNTIFATITWFGSWGVYFRGQILTLAEGMWGTLNGWFSTFFTAITSPIHAIVTYMLESMGLAAGGMLSAGLFIAVSGVAVCLVYFLTKRVLLPLLSRMWPAIRDLVQGVPLWRKPGFQNSLLLQMQKGMRQEQGALRALAVSSELARVPLEFQDARLLLATVESSLALPAPADLSHKETRRALLELREKLRVEPALQQQVTSAAQVLPPSLLPTPTKTV